VYDDIAVHSPNCSCSFSSSKLCSINYLYFVPV